MPTDRDALYQRIAQRFERMLQNGFLNEVKTLYARGDLSADLPAIRSVGYRQAWDHLAGHIDANALHETGIAATRQLAKRQLTWLRSWTGLHEISSPEPFDLKKVTQAALKVLATAGI